MDLNGYQEMSVKRSEPHWYLTVYEQGCVLCGAGNEAIRVRMPGKTPKNIGDRYREEGAYYSCGNHFY